MPRRPRTLARRKPHALCGQSSPRLRQICFGYSGKACPSFASRGAFGPPRSVQYANSPWERGHEVGALREENALTRLKILRGRLIERVIYQEECFVVRVNGDIRMLEVQALELRILGTHQPHPGFMNQGRGPQGVPG